MPETLSFTETVRQVTELRHHRINATKVIEVVPADHAHWQSGELVTGEYYDVGQDFREWADNEGVWKMMGMLLLAEAKPKSLDLISWGLGSYMGFPEEWEVHNRLIQAYLKKRGLPSFVYGSTSKLLDFKSRTKINPFGSIPWNPNAAARIFPEIDWFILFQPADGLRNPSLWPHIDLNLCMTETPLFKPHATGSPYEPSKNVGLKRIVSGEGYIARIDNDLKERGYKWGVEGLVITDGGLKILRAFQEAIVYIYIYIYRRSLRAYALRATFLSEKIL